MFQSIYHKKWILWQKKKCFASSFPLISVLVAPVPLGLDCCFCCCCVCCGCYCYFYPRNLHLKFDQNQVSSSWDIADIAVSGWVGGGVQCHFHVKLILRLSWVGVVTNELYLMWTFRTFIYSTGFNHPDRCDPQIR